MPTTLSFLQIPATLTIFLFQLTQKALFPLRYALKPFLARPLNTTCRSFALFVFFLCNSFLVRLQDVCKVDRSVRSLSVESQVHRVLVRGGFEVFSLGENLGVFFGAAFVVHYLGYSIVDCLGEELLVANLQVA